jgi:hypothetical protein
MNIPLQNKGETQDVAGKQTYNYTECKKLQKSQSWPGFACCDNRAVTMSSCIIQDFSMYGTLKTEGVDVPLHFY